MGFLDGLFKKTPTPQELEVQRRIAISRAKQQVNRLLDKSVKLTAEYGDRWEEAKQYLKVGKKHMAEMAARRCRSLKREIAQYETRYAGASALLGKLEFAATNAELVSTLQGVAVTVGGSMEQATQAWTDLGVKIAGIDAATEMLTTAGDEALAENEYGSEQLPDLGEMIQDMADEVAMELGTTTAREQPQTVSVGVQMPRDEVTEMVDTGSARLQKLMEEFK